MTLHPHWGHTQLLYTLARARASGSLPASLLIQGPRGVGKQHLALWLGRLLLCPSPGPAGPCEECKSCKLAVRLEHPDLHWYFPLPRPKKATTPEKLAQALEEARWDTLAEIRKDPLQPVPLEGPRSLYLAAARTLRRQAQNRPSMGDRQVFIIAEAEALAPGETSSEAANALLKLLEEPPGGTTLILTSGEPGRLLPTIRSRTTHLHLPPLTVDEVTEFLIRMKAVEPEEAKRLALLSQGAIGRALRLLPEGEESGSLEKIRQEAFQLLKAAVDPWPGAEFQEALSFARTGARGLMELFDALEGWLRDLALVASGGMASLLNPGSEEFFQGVLAKGVIRPGGLGKALDAVEEARLSAAGNVNPQLVVFDLLAELRQTLTVSAPPAPARR